MDDGFISRGMDRRRFLQMLGAGGALATVPGLLEACGPGSGSSLAPSSNAKVPFYNGTFTLSFTNNPVGMDPQVNVGTESYQTQRAIYQTLIDYDPGSDRFFPQLIEQLPDLSNPRSLTMKLRSGMKFHDGSPVSADDVKATFDFILQQGTKSPSYSIFQSLAEVKIVDTLTFTLNLKAPASSMISYLAGMQGAIVKKAARQGGQDLARKPQGAGNGPFELVEWVDGDHILLQRYKDYHRPGYPKYEKLQYKIILDISARAAQILAGTIDFAGEVPKKDFQRIISSPGVQGKPGPAQKVDIVWFNQYHPLGKDLHLRRAINFATDGAALLQAVYSGNGVVAHGPLRPGSKWYDPAVEKVSYFDLNKAKDELKQSTQPNGFTFDLYCENDPIVVQQCTLLQSMWGKIGAKANLLPLDKTSFLAKCKHKDPNWFMGASNWSDGIYSPDYMLKTNYTSLGSFQRTGWFTPEVDDLVDQVEQTSDLAKQKELMSKASLKVAEAVPTIFFTWQVWTPAWRDYVKGYVPAKTYYYYLDEVSIAPH
jgi:peptide/nickel transport system substrate-binding protein